MMKMFRVYNAIRRKKGAENHKWEDRAEGKESSRNPNLSGRHVFWKRRKRNQI